MQMSATTYPTDTGFLCKLNQAYPHSIAIQREIGSMVAVTLRCTQTVDVNTNPSCTMTL